MANRLWLIISLFILFYVMLISSILLIYFVFEFDLQIMRSALIFKALNSDLKCNISIICCTKPRDILMLYWGNYVILRMLALKRIIYERNAK
jgi:hypothetical protein